MLSTNTNYIISKTNLFGETNHIKQENDKMRRT
ncbi:MAG: hypothetical protein H6Q73_2882 [Firmicutes bacterium]|nr:hypothetical protein [Bacillota bacterium]